MEILAQCLGIFNLIALVIDLLTKAKSKRLIWFIISNLFAFATYFVLGRFLGAVLVFVATLRFFVFYIYSKNNRNKSVWVLTIFELAFILISIFMWQGYADILIILNLCVATYANWQDNIKVFNILYILTSMFCIPYNFIVGAYSANLSEFVLVGTIVFSMIKDYKEQKNELKITEQKEA